MVEEIIVSGRHLPEIDPRLTIWGWEIALYLFLGGLVAGILFFSALLFLQGKGDRFGTTVKRLPVFAPVLLVIGLLALLLDLSHLLYFWQLFTTIRWESPMSWGAWTLLVVLPLSVIWALSWWPEWIPGWSWKNPALKDFFGWVERQRVWLARILIVLSVLLGMYTGILLSAFNSRPFWNSAIMGPLFLTSGLSTGAAAIVLFSRDREERRLFSRIDLLLIMIELFFIIHLFMGLLAGTRVHIEAVELFMGGPYTTPFWVFVVGLGLVIPAILESLEFTKTKIPGTVPAVLVLVGGILLRLILVDAGQASRWLY
ncbi:MAG: nitrite reductase [Candidatus Neomarinimicrobiota bacterium]|nr:MAG: nitrite reductase [Candidatus Neomarinimicrobiota bacterium]